MTKETSAHNAERAPLVVKTTARDAVDVEIADRARHAGGEGEATPTARGKWSIAGRAALAVACATFAAVGVARASTVRRGGEVVTLFPELGGLSEWRRDFVAGKIALGRKFSDTVPSKTCVRQTSRNRLEDVEKYYIVRAMNHENELHKGDKTIAAMPTYDHIKAESMFMTGMVNKNSESPYMLPSSGYEKSIKQSGNSAMMYNFVHIPKAGGTYLCEVLQQVQSHLDARHGSVFGNHNLYRDRWSMKPLLDATSRNVWQTTHLMKSKLKAFTDENLARGYAKGQRMMSKGSYNMGLCSTTEAPCMYLTVLRNPFQRFMSHYKYSCLEGAENRAMWMPAWKKQGSCPLNPLEWFYFTQGDDWTHLIAPGAFPRDSQCHIDAAKNNLMSGCMRYLITENLHDGLAKLKNKLPDFATLDLNAVKSLFKNDSAGRLTPALQARLKRYEEDKNMMHQIKQGLWHQTKIYNFAVENYEKSWDRDIQTC